LYGIIILFVGFMQRFVDKNPLVYGPVIERTLVSLVASQKASATMT
jgi:hypothetical protein